MVTSKRKKIKEKASSLPESIKNLTEIGDVALLDTSETVTEVLLSTGLKEII